MYELLTQVLLWILIGYIAWFVLKQFIPQKIYTFLGFALLVTLIVLAFFEPSQGIVSEAWSILSLPFRPLGFILICLLIEFSFDSITKGKFVRDPVFWAIVLLLVTSAPATAYWLHGEAERDATSLMKNNPVGGPAPIVLMAQDTTVPLLAPRTQIEMTESGDRIRYAAQLFAEQPGSSVIVAADRRSGISDAPRESLNESNEVRAVLTSLGVPNEAIRVANDSGTVRESAQNVGKLLKDTNTREIVLVTSALEMQRAASAFTHTLQELNGGQGVRVVPRPTDFVTIQSTGKPKRKLRFPQDVVPNERALSLTSQALQEQFISVYYFLRGWLSAVI
ncbi:MAG: YdcF family protein [Synechococcales cyanobacterium RU_4_20]|nr:YdcF family protein [Synechococcales cyanobacterium RU_4_20]NJR69969.1 YdcF family protein [Synechococcales cyanobacterium CRU_2_2]